MTGRRESDERAMLRESVRALVSRHADPRAGIDGYADGFWHRLHAQIGGAAVVIPEQYGGGGGTVGDLVVILDELGAGLVPSPMLGTAIATAALVTAESDEVRARLLPRFAETAATATVVVDPAVVVDAVVADVVLGVVDGRLVEYPPSITRRPLSAVDPTRALAAVDVIGSTPTDLGPAGIAGYLAWLFVAAEQVGAARSCLDRTVEYTSTRVQFGRPVGSFQALKHRMADLYADVEVARALVYDAADTLDPASVSAAALYASDTSGAVAAEAVQMHGGIGVTWEHDISLYFKRAHGDRYLYSSPRERLERVTAAAGL